ncbi:hypothetical protein B9X37_11885 [Acinetobacter pittii]|nr:hypothetical protein B9X37_11885 [Acinetobacter pittii]
MIRDETLRVEKTDLDFSFFKNEKPLILDRDISVLILPSFTQKDAFHNGTANSNMRCDSFKSHMIINKLSKFL